MSEDQPYDRDLTVEHIYLGDDMVEVHGRTILNTNETHELIVIAKRRVMLVPGQSVPIILNRPDAEANLMNEMIHERRVFGLLYPNQYRYGTTADVRSLKEGPSDGGFSNVCLKAQASQRFEVVDVNLHEGELIFRTKIRIIPELTLSDPRRLLFKPFKGLCHTLTPFPRFAYNACNLRRFMSEISDLIERLTGKRAPEMDPNIFSYWVVANMPLNEADRLKLLLSQSSNERIFLAHAMLIQDLVIYCVNCSSCLSTESEMFSMSSSGLQETFVNMHGYNHEMITVRQITDVLHYGESSEEFSWFPGYAWNVCQCKGCGDHVGWRFTAVDEHLIPKLFWGLSRAAIKFSEGANPDFRAIIPRMPLRQMTISRRTLQP